MKNKFLILTASLFAIATLTQCGKDCAKEECDEPPAPLFFFRVVNNTGADLVVGPSKIYDTSQVKISARRTSNGALETVLPTFFLIKNGSNTVDSICTTGITVKNDYSVYYLSLKNVVTDSLFFGITKRHSLCCDLSSYYFAKHNLLTIPNGGAPLPIATSYKIIK